jgi:septum formation protein
VLGKPQDVEDAQRMLALLSGQTHTVLTAVVLLTEFELKKALSISEVSFMRLSPQQIVNYVESKEPFGKAGAYAIQGFAGAFIDKLKGSYTGVMGLPLHETFSLLSV